jgi:hypothetical protein
MGSCSERKPSVSTTVFTTVRFRRERDYAQVIERMVRPERFELPTFWFVARRSIQLS